MGSKKFDSIIFRILIILINSCAQKNKITMKIILIMGLPGSGKTTLANEIAP